MLEEESREIDFNCFQQYFLLRLLVNIKDLQVENGLAELDGDIFCHFEPNAIVLSCEITLIVNNASAIIGDLLQLAACSTFSGRGGRFFTSCGFRFCWVDFFLRNWFFSLDLDQIPVLEKPSIDDGEGDLFSIGAGCDIDPIVLEFQIVACFMLELT